MKILITDGDYKHSLGIVRALGKKGHRCFTVYKKKQTLTSRSKYCEKSFIVPDYKSSEFQKSFLQILQDKKIDLVIPVGTSSYEALSKFKDEIQKHTNLHLVSKEKLSLAFSKKQTYELAEKCGVPYPKSFYPEKISDIETFAYKVAYPCVIKWIYEVGGNIVDYAYDAKELKEKYKTICQKYNFTPHSGLPLIQEYIEGFGCGFFAVYQKGKCGPTFQHKRIREMPPSGGVSVCAESFFNKSLEEFGKKLLDELEWHGIAMVEFKMKSNGVPILMEINPKFWGSTDLALEAGVNFPNELVKMTKSEILEFSNKYKNPFRYHWPLHGDFAHAFQNPKNFFAVLKDTLNPFVSSNIWFIDDFFPTLYMLKQNFKKLLRKVIKKNV